MPELNFCLASKKNDNEDFKYTYIYMYNVYFFLMNCMRPKYHDIIILDCSSD